MFAFKNVEFNKCWDGRVLKVDEKIELLSQDSGIRGVSNGVIDRMQVYIPGENVFLNVLRQNLRVFRDWTGSQWIDKFARRVYLRDDMLTVSGEIVLNLIGCMCKLLKLSGARCKAENPIGEFALLLAMRPGGRRSYVEHGTLDALALKMDPLEAGSKHHNDKNCEFDSSN
ncbi:hypothetical protein Nepgr_025036 [Nepenthes gracilis]|uniref:Uncharacterized protein n=1 Tax=Nepenthes gracilis TaxID=150966 RepID=A0AAD3T404_NEPGR|nr:hypothetical protein Nepgr_025036 [Nepenthes gracilis]